MAHDRILIVDDDTAALNKTASVLAQKKYEVVTAYDVADAIALLERDAPFDVILSEIVLNGADGVRVVQRMMTLSPGTPLVVMTALRDIHAAINTLRSGAFDYLLKPVESGVLFDAVARASEHRHRTLQHSLDKENLERLVAARTDLLHAAIADLEQAYDITLEALGDALDLKDAETEGHSRRVTAYTIALARAMGLSGEAIRVVSRGAFLHDIGKMAIPDAILLKPGKLDRHELAMMREHCARGYQILKKIPFLRDAAQIVYSHQERYDGTGYPRRLKGDEIVLGARIFAVADTLDAITSDRPYRRSNTFEAASAEILRCSGTQFDPEVIRVFESLPIRLWEDLQTEITHHARVSSLSSK
ncbi:MAG TPA: HD domain-containing phosphohydrolase [Acidobacteriaceae bacterium]|nr:HD domain-containing phosphohydrolase [Acidobacteriaceae bacterium]